MHLYLFEIFKLNTHCMMFTVPGFKCFYMQYILIFLSPCTNSGISSTIIPTLEWEQEALRDEMTCPRAHDHWTAQLGFRHSLGTLWVVDLWVVQCLFTHSNCNSLSYVNKYHCIISSGFSTFFPTGRIILFSLKTKSSKIKETCPSILSHFSLRVI